MKIPSLSFSLPRNLSKFDLGFIIAFVVVTLMGGGGYWYLSGLLDDAQNQDKSAKEMFDKYSKDPKYKVAVSPTNIKILQDNIDVLKKQIDPLIPAELQPKENKLPTIPKEDPVAWKHDLDDDVHRLTAAAKTRGVIIPANFYFGFSRYLSQSPGDEQTLVLSKQLLGVDEIANILIKAPVKSIQAINRTYEEDPHQGSGNSPGPSGEKDHLVGYAFTAPNNTYISYPFEADFVTTSESLRSILSELAQSPYIFVVRTISVTNSAVTGSGSGSPELNILDSLAGTSGPVSTDISAGPAPVKGPQYLFGANDSTIKVKMRIDMIEWKGGQQ